jgi:hypothetical protein
MVNPPEHMHATNFIILDDKLENIHTEGDFFGVTTTKFFTGI